MLNSMLTIHQLCITLS